MQAGCQGYPEPRGREALQSEGQGGKIRYVPVHPLAQRFIEHYLQLASRDNDEDGPQFRPVLSNRTGELEKPLDPNSIYRNVVRKHGQETGLNIEVNGLCVNSMCATAATNALSHETRRGPRIPLRFGCGISVPAILKHGFVHYVF